MSGGRIGRGWQLAKESWAVLRADRSLALFPVVSAVSILAAAVVIAGPGVALAATDTATPVAIVLWVVAAYVLVFIGLFCNTALAAAASQSLDGRDTTLGDGFAVARQRTGVIARWALVQLTVGALINAIEAALAETPVGRIVAGIVSTLLSAAWSVVTFFVVPVLALEGVGPREALSRSTTIIKERWGEGFVGSASISGVIFVVVGLPSIAIGVLGVAASGGSPALGGVLIAIAAAGIVGALLLGSTLNAIFRVVLFRYVTQDQLAPGFDRSALDGAFRPKRRR